jgi:hypothetical protein
MTSSDAATLPGGHPRPRPVARGARVPSEAELSAIRKRATKCVEGSAQLRPHHYVLLEDPLQHGPTRYASVPTDVDEINAHHHFLWLVGATKADVSQFAEWAEKDLADQLREYLSDVLYACEAPRTSVDPILRERLQQTAQLANRGLENLDRQTLSDAAGHTWESMRSVDRAFDDYHQRLQKLPKPFVVLREHGLIRQDHRGRLVWLGSVGMIKALRSAVPQFSLVELSVWFVKSDGEPMNYLSIKNNAEIALPEDVRSALEGNK